MMDWINRENLDPYRFNRHRSMEMGTLTIFHLELSEK